MRVIFFGGGGGVEETSIIVNWKFALFFRVAEKINCRIYSWKQIPKDFY